LRRLAGRCDRHDPRDRCGVGICGRADSPQAVAKPTAAEVCSRIAAHRADFGYLPGEWKFSAVSKQYGTFDGV
jgi:hypothetical protein